MKHARVQVSEAAAADILEAGGLVQKAVKQIAREAMGPRGCERDLGCRESSKVRNTVFFPIFTIERCQANADRRISEASDFLLFC